ncbi:hypothetical protein BH09MYX1_BH09MYX1_47070 [soil metagenome]
MSGFALTIRTGDPELDRRQVEHYRQQAAASGHVFQADPLPTGGWAVRAEPAISATLPSNLGEYRPSQAPPALASPHDFLPHPVMGTMPSRLGQARPAPSPEIHMATPGGICQLCGRAGPTKSVSFNQNVGVLVMRFHRSVGGYLCKFCIDKHFFRMTGITLLFGWWGMISFVISLISIPANFIGWIRSIGMQTPPEDAGSVADRRSRGTVQIVLGSLISVAAAVFTLLGLLIVGNDHPDMESGIEAATIGLVIGALALVLIAFGIRSRLKASAIERRLQGAYG